MIGTVAFGLFQFHNGAIKSHRFAINPHFKLQFQFHNGAIKRLKF